MTQQTVTINGTVYDSHTGKTLHVGHSQHKSTKSASQGAHAVHVQTQRSKTLNRRYVRKGEAALHAAPEQAKRAPVAVPKPAHRAKATHAISVHRAPSVSTASRSEHVRRFAAHPAPAHTPTTAQHHDIKPIPHPLAESAHRQLASKQPAERVVKPSHIIKQEAIEHATAKMPAKHTRKVTHHKKAKSTFRRLASIGSASLAVLVLGAYLTYLNMPALSTRIAATQAGIDASYPSYQPMGYSLSGPVAYKEGTVSMKFAANAGPQNYTLTQTKSGWDSSAVLEYYVAPNAGGNYITTTTNGLTIYTYGDNAVWVNGGILYTINGNATLSDSQIQRIATSL